LNLYFKALTLLFFLKRNRAVMKQEIKRADRKNWLQQWLVLFFIVSFQTDAFYWIFEKKEIK
jgi:hypothetical protein